jgi:hypothetical protein
MMKRLWILAAALGVMSLAGLSACGSGSSPDMAGSTQTNQAAAVEQDADVSAWLAAVQRQQSASSD